MSLKLTSMFMQWVEENNGRVKGFFTWRDGVSFDFIYQNSNFGWTTRSDGTSKIWLIYGHSWPAYGPGPDSNFIEVSHHQPDMFAKIVTFISGRL